MYILRFSVGVLLAGPGGFASWHTFAGMASWVCVCVAIYALNGVSDVNGDRRNGSLRPIAAGALPIRTAWRLIMWMIMLGLAAAALVSTKLVVTFVLMLGVGWAYSFGSRPLKNSLAGLVITGTSLGGLTYLAGWLAARGELLSVELVVFGIGMSLWMGLVGTATKDLKDVSGDRLAGRRTLPILLGPHRAMLIAGGVSVAFGVIFHVVVHSTAPALALPALCVLTGGLMLATVPWQTRQAATDSGTRAYHIYMITQFAGNLISLV